MGEHTKTPKLVMGHIVVMGPNDEEGIPYDEALIHLEGDEDSEINVHCPGAIRLAPRIVKAVNNHESMDRLLAEAADFLNTSPTMEGMEIGARITQFRLALQKTGADHVGGSRT